MENSFVLLINTCCCFKVHSHRVKTKSSFDICRFFFDFFSLSLPLSSSVNEPYCACLVTSTLAPMHTELKEVRKQIGFPNSSLLVKLLRLNIKFRNIRNNVFFLTSGDTSPFRGTTETPVFGVQRTLKPRFF